MLSKKAWSEAYGQLKFQHQIGLPTTNIIRSNHDIGYIAKYVVSHSLDDISTEGAWRGAVCTQYHGDEYEHRFPAGDPRASSTSSKFFFYLFSWTAKLFPNIKFWFLLRSLVSEFQNK